MLRRRVSLRVRIMAAVAVGLSAVMAVLGVIGVQVLQESKRRLLEERLITARALAERLDDALLMSIRHLEGLAATARLGDVTARAGARTDWAGLARREPLASYGLYLLDTRGTVRQAGGPRRADVGTSFAALDVVRQVLTGRRLAISGLAEAPRTRTPIVLLCVAARPGALCAATDLTRLPFDRYIGGVRLGQTGHAVLVDIQGRVLAATDPDDRFKADEHPDFHAGLIARGEARVGPAVYYEGGRAVENHIMALAPLRLAPWGVSFGQTEAETLAPVARTRARLLGFGTLALLFALAFAWWDTGTVIRPLRRLVDHTRRIAGGDLSRTVHVDRADELGELAAGFEVMRERLRGLLDDLTRREAEAHALYAVSREVLSQPNLGEVLRSITGHARRLLGADVAVLCLAGERWEGAPAAVSGPQEAVSADAVPVPLCAVQGRPPSGRIPVEGCPVLRPEYRRGHAAASLVLDGQVEGALCVGFRQAATLDDRASGLLDGLANLAAIALRSADLHAQLHHLAVVEERERIGRDLHDSTLQSLYGIALTLEAARASLAADAPASAGRLDQGLRAMSALADEIRGYVRGLHVREVFGRTLEQALAAVVDEVNALGTVAVRLAVRNGAAEVGDADRAQLILIAREALANVVRHSRAGRAEVRLESDGEWIRVEVRDDGCGFDPGAPPARGEGLRNMATRAEQMGGRLTVHSAPGQGAAVSVAVPRRGRGGG